MPAEHLTRKGNNLWGLCPFHNEKTPSFSVSPDKQIYHCFGCGKGGGVISFIMEIENLPFPDAVRLLAQRAGLEVPDTGADDAGRKKRARALAANRDAARFYHDYLKGPGGARVRDYLAQRQIAPRTATRFGLGAAPEQWDALTRALTAKGYSKMELIDAGLAVAGKNGGVYDKFRARLMLPVIDVRGEVAGFTSRILPGEEGVEYIGDEMNVVESPRATNFLLTEGDWDFGRGQDRFAVLEETMEASGGVLTEEEGMALLQAVSQQPQPGKDSSTQWSCLYNQVRGTVDIAVAMDYDSLYHFAIDE